MSQDSQENTALTPEPKYPARWCEAATPSPLTEESPNPSAPEVPQILHSRCVNLFRQRLVEEYEPVGVTELAIVGDLARRMAAMDRWGAGAEAVERHAAHSFSLLHPAVPNSGDIQDAILAGALASEAADRCERHALGHSRAFYRALHKLEEIQARRKKRQQVHENLPPAAFADEAACESYLADRFRQGNCPCPQCGGTRGYFFPTRKSWECGECKTQVGLRSGTLMTRSPLALVTWFEAIRWLLWRPTINTMELAKKLPIRRISTVRNIAHKIRAALDQENASELLADLDHYWARLGT